MAKPDERFGNVLKQLRASGLLAAGRGIVDEDAVHVIILLLDEAMVLTACDRCAIYPAFSVSSAQRA